VLTSWILVWLLVIAPDDPATSVASALTNEPWAPSLNVADVDDVDHGIPDEICRDVRVTARRPLVRALIEASQRSRLASAEDPRPVPRGPPRLVWVSRSPSPPCELLECQRRPGARGSVDPLPDRSRSSDSSTVRRPHG
jgi:hypothetical protein